MNESYTHDLEKLLGVAELKDKLDNESKNNPTLRNNWAIVRDWTEQARYDDSMSVSEARSLYSACTARRNGVLAWLKKWW